MKKTLSIFLAVMMISVLCATLVVSADAQKFYVTDFDFEGNGYTGTEGMIFTETDTVGAWWTRAAFAPVEGAENVWKVVAVNNPDGTGEGVAPLAVPEGGFVWALHFSCADATALPYLAALTVDGMYTITGFDLANKTCADDATIAPFEGTIEPPAPAAEWKDLWLTHYNNNTVEGSGVVFTEAYTGAGWWYHVAFAPVEGSKNAYEIVAVSDGTPDGNGVAQALPEGGFVYCLNYGNNYGDVDYTSENVNNMIADVKDNWKIGDKFVFKGIDFANKTVPTTTPDVEWYKDGEYVCTAQYKVYEPAIDDVETDDESEDESEDKTPEAGDASSMIVFAVIALVAIAGSAVVIKTRR